MEVLKINNKNSEVEVLNNNLKSLTVTKNENQYNLIAFDPDNFASSFIMAPWVNRIKNGKFKCEKGENGKRAKVRSNSKYCSRDCSNRNARWRHKQRKK